jgi:putative multiple sugar transport system permease protein
MELKRLLRGNMREYAMAFALILIILLFQVLTGGILLRPLNVTNIILQNSYVLILAMGMLLCIISGGNIDLSVGSVVAFIGAVSATFIIKLGLNVWVSIGLLLAIGILIGMWQGFWIAYMEIPSFIVTLAGMLIFRGLTLVILQGRTIGPYPSSFQALSSGFIPDLKFGGEMHFLSILMGVIASIVFIILEMLKNKQKKKQGYPIPSRISTALKLSLGILVINAFTLTVASYRGVSLIMIILIILIAIYTVITNRTTFGRHIYAMGGNAKAATLSGIDTKKVLFIVYANMGLLAAFAGIVIAGRLNAATPKAGVSFELDAIASCFIGGASTTGGIGTVFGTIIGALIMGVLNNGMSIMGVSVDWQQTIKGMVLLFAVAFDFYTKRRAGR